MADGTLNEFVLPDAVRRRILKDYVTHLCAACRVFRIPLNCLDYCEQELSLAVEEAEIDIKAMFARRSRTNGIAVGKIAGIFAFRLSRFKIVHIRESGWNQRYLYLVQELAAVFLVKRLFMLNAMPETSVLELTYQLSRRHANQETAGLFFDAFSAKASMPS